MMWRIGRLKIEAISTPGHTPGSMSYLLRDAGAETWIVFIGDLGRIVHFSINQQVMD